MKSFNVIAGCWVILIVWASPIFCYEFFVNFSLNEEYQQISSLNQNNGPPMLLSGGQTTINFYQSKHLIYLGLEMSTGELIEKSEGVSSVSKDVSISMGLGYRRILSPTRIMGVYSFLDFIGKGKFSHLNLGIEYFKVGYFSLLPKWQIHTNFYIPIQFEYDQNARILLPETFDIRQTILEQNYFLAKGNFGFDTKASSETIFGESLKSFVGFYSFYDRYGKQFILGSAFGLEYQKYNYKLFCKVTTDNCENHTFTIGVIAYDLFNTSTYNFHDLCLPRERNLLPPQIQMQNRRPLKSVDEARWAGVPPRPTPTAYRRAQQEREYWRGREYWEQYQQQREEQEREYEQQQWKRHQEQREREYRQREQQWKQQQERNRREERFHTNWQQGDTPIEKAYKFFSTHSGASVVELKKMSQKDLKEVKRTLWLKLHPDRRNYSKEECTRLSQELNNHVETFKQKGKLPT
jgi:hypothetical protein